MAMVAGLAARAATALRGGLGNKLVKLGVGAGNGVLDMELAKRGGTGSIALLVKNIAVPAAYVFGFEDSFGVVEASAISSTYFWGLIMNAPAPAPRRQVRSRIEFLPQVMATVRR